MANPEPSLFDEVDEEAEERALERARADHAAGRVVPHERVRDWLLTWGATDRPPAPRSCDE